MTDEQIRQAARQCRDEALCDALRLAADGDIDATAVAILVEALKQATPELSAQGRQRLFEAAQ